MPSKRMLPKGARRKTVRPQYIAVQEELERQAELEREAELAREAAAWQEEELPEDDELLPEEAQEPAETPRQLTVDAAAAGTRLDQYLAKHLPDISRARAQLLIEQEQVRVDGQAAKASLKLRGGEQLDIEGEPRPAPLHAIAEEIPLDVIYEDKDLAVINKPADMMVHAGSGATDDARNRGTLVNALLHHFNQLSTVGGELRPGIVHRLDKQTSGLILVAKNDSTHRKLGEMFAMRQFRKTYVALVHGHPKQDSGTIHAAISRDTIRRTRMTTRREGGRTAISHYQVLERIEGPYGKFALVEVRIETGRTHQIRVHMSSIGHPVVGDTLYGAPHEIFPVEELAKPGSQSTPRKRVGKKALPQEPALTLERNFLHAARLEFLHPKTKKQLALAAPLPDALDRFLHLLRGEQVA
ncbi:MAG: RluA family pseudouridine synthase [Acidobacteriaceae bacterium]